MNKQTMSFNTFLASTEEKWNSLVERSANATVYHLWEWGETLSQTYGYTKHYLVSKLDNEIAGVFPLIYVQSMLFGNRLISLPFCEYGGIVLRLGLKPEEANQAIKSLTDVTNELARTIGTKYIEVREPLVLRDAFHLSGYAESQVYTTFRVNLRRGTKLLWSGLRKNTRNAVRKAVKSGLEVEIAKESEQLKAYYDLYLQTQKRLGSPPHCYKLFENLFDAFSTSGKMRILLAKHRGKPIAGIIVFSYEKTIFWWNNVTDAKYRSLNPTNLLLWNTIEWGVENGYHVMDMGRTRKGTTIYYFKSGWGGHETPLHDYVRFLSSRRRQLPDPSQRKFRYLSNVWSFVPIAVARKIGPRVISGIAL